MKKSIFWGIQVAFVDKETTDETVNRAVSVALVCSALVSVIEISLINVPLFSETKNFFDLISIQGIILAAVCWFVLKKKNPHPVVILGMSAVAGILLGFVGLI